MLYFLNLGFLDIFNLPNDHLVHLVSEALVTVLDVLDVLLVGLADVLLLLLQLLNHDQVLLLSFLNYLMPTSKSLR